MENPSGKDWVGLSWYSKMILVIDAHNIRAGGGVTHLLHLVDESYYTSRFHATHIFGGHTTHEYLKGRIRYPVVFHEESLLNGNVIKRNYWYRYVLPRRLQELKADVLFSPGGLLPSSLPSNVRTVTMNQNILPFMFAAANKDGLKLLIRRMLQRYLQLNSYRRADGVIFLSESARNIVSKIIPDVLNKSVIIPHGISEAFRREPVHEKRDSENKIGLLYVSNIKSYKYQWNVVEAMSILRERGYDNIKLTLVGPGDSGPLKKLKSAIDTYKMKDRVVWLGAVPYEEIVETYHNASIFVYASTCETFGQTVLEAMASGLPIACSNRGPMKEFAKDGAKYFDPENPLSIADAVGYLIDNHDDRKRLALRAYELSKKYTWKDCAEQTFDFLWEVNGDHQRIQ